MSKTGIMICGHGSRAKSAEEEFALLAKGVRERYPDTPVEYGFLEYSAPNIHMGLNALRDAGVTNIIAVPGMLFAATHAKNDIPSVLTTYQDKNPGLTVQYGRELGLHPKMVAAFEARILEALGVDHVHDGDLYDTMLVVVGRGTSDTLANAEAARLTRIVAENLGFGWSETVYSGVTYPSVGRGLEMALLARKVTRDGQDIDLQPREFRLLEYLMKHAGQVVTRTMLLENVWEYHFDPQTNVIDVHISRLRAKIDKNFETPLLHTVRGAGYTLRAPG